MKQNFKQGLHPVAASKNSIFTPTNTGTISSSWDWASKLIANNTTPDRSTRDASLAAWHGTNHLAWDTAKLMSSVGKGLLSSYWNRAVVAPNNAAWSSHPLTNFKLGLGEAVSQKLRDHALANFKLHDSKAISFRESFFGGRHKHGSGWGGGQQVLVVQPEASLLERWIRAKLSITKHLLLAKLRLHKTVITSTVPSLVKLKLNIINNLLNSLSQKDISHFFRSLRLLRQAIWRGKVNFWRALIAAKQIPAEPELLYGVPTLKKPEVPSLQYGVAVTPSLQYGQIRTPDLSYGYVAPSQRKPEVLNNVQYGASPNQQYGNTPSPNYGGAIPQETFTTLRNPLYAFPSFNKDEVSSNYGDFTKHEQVFPTLPPVALLRPPSPFSQTATDDAIVVSGKFLRDLMRQSSFTTPSIPLKADPLDLHRHKPRSSLEDQSSSIKIDNKFSSQLLQSGFTRS